MSKFVSKEHENHKSKVVQRYPPGVRAQKDIRKYQSSTELLLNKIPFRGLVLDVSLSITKDESLK